MSKNFNIYTINPSQPFLKTLAQGLLEKYEYKPFFSDVRILLPTRRAGRILRDQFLEISKGKPLILPQISSLGDVDVDELSLTTLTNTQTDILPAISPLKRQLLMSELVSKVGVLSLDESHSFALAGSLATLIDQIHTEDKTFDDLTKVFPENLSDQWKVSLQFLSIIKDAWPKKLKELGLIDPADRRRQLMKALISHWQKNPIETPVIAAGSTGSIPITADLLRTISKLPQGEVILPGVDLGLDSEGWKAVEEGHPQATLKILLERMDVPRARVQLWSHAKMKTSESRERLWREVMRPAETISQWQTSLENMDKNTFQNVHLLNCETQEQEAHSIALLLRETLTEKDKTAALVTPDRALAERVKTYIHRWNINIDDTAGEPLTQTITGRFIRAVLQAAKEEFSPVSLLTLLKHPYSRFGLEEGEVGRLAQKLDRKPLRGPWTNGRFKELLTELQEKEETNDLYIFLSSIQKTLKPLTQKLKDSSASLYKITQTHIEACEEVASNAKQSGQDVLWAGDEGEVASRFFQDLLACFSETSKESTFFSDTTKQGYTTIFDSYMFSISVRPKYGTHPRLSILGQLEARLIHADRVILSGLNEDVWPALPKQDPWMSRGMRKEMGLPLPERNITLSAHDFVQGACAKEVFLTRAEKVANVPSVPARWLQRLNAICQSIEYDPKTSTKKYLVWSQKMNHADESEKITLEAPYPIPPVEKRPKKFSVSSLELLMRDPYSLYAKKILRLRPLDPLEEAQGPKEKGKYFHDILHKFTEEWPDKLPDDAQGELIRIGKDMFGESLDDPSLWVSWWPRFENMAGWFVTHEQEWRNKGYQFKKAEVEGTTQLGSYMLTARADRIDKDESGQYAVIDYKTSSTKYLAKQVRAGFYPQLPVEALILQDGSGQGFNELPNSETNYVGYWHTTGSKDGGEEMALFDKKAPFVKDIVEEAKGGIENVLNAYEDASRGYPNNPFPGKEPPYPDYEHLSRILEWGTSGDDSEAA